MSGNQATSPDSGRGKSKICQAVHAWISTSGLALCSSPHSPSQVELGLTKTQRRGDPGARRAPVEAQEGPVGPPERPWDGALEVRSARAFKLYISNRRRAKLEALNPLPERCKKKHAAVGARGAL